MKAQSLVLVSTLAIALAACQRQAPERVDAAPTPSPATASAPPVDEPMEGALPAEAGPAPVAEQTAQAPARRPSAPAQRPQGRPAPVEPPMMSEPVREAQVVPEPKPTPTPVPRIVDAGTVLPIRLQETVSSKTASPEDKVLAELVEDVVDDRGRVLLPAGSEITGHVVTAVRSGRVKGKARLVVAFDEVSTGRRSYEISATPFDVVAGSSKGKDAKIAGGAAAAGAIIGAIADGGSGAVKGGLIGGAAGGAAVLATRGAEVELKAGTPYKLTLRKPLRLD